MRDLQAPATPVAVSVEAVEPLGLETVRAENCRFIGPPAFGFSLARYRLWVIGVFAAAFTGISLAQELVWDFTREPAGVVENVLIWLSLAWMIPLVPALLGTVGLLMYRLRAEPLRPTTVPFCFRVVSRGHNRQALQRTVTNIRSQMDQLPLFRYRIEVVTDIAVELRPASDLVTIVVPDAYRTAQSSLFKARALQYAVEYSDLPDDAWILHLDEESHITTSLIAGMQAAADEEERSGEHRIGQGLILYHRELARNPFLTLADSIRTGDDVGRFYLQHRLGVTLFGLHGSFILVRNSVEKAVGFDFGPEGSVTEDAYWALMQMEGGRRCRWVEGYVVEQSPRTGLDFLKQRRRWFVGLRLVYRHAPVRPAFRLPMALFTNMWAVSWVGILYTYANLLVVAPPIPLEIRLLANFGFAHFVLLYLLGLRLNLHHAGSLQRLQRLRLYLGQVALIPVFAVLEGAGVVYALVKPDTGFHVIRK